MRFYLLFILFIGIVACQIGCAGNKSFFKNKILIYNSEVSGDFRDTVPNSSFIDFYKDSIFVVGSPYRPFEETNNLLDSNLYPYAQVPMKFKRTKKSIYVDYAIKSKTVHMKYFALNKGDSVNTSSYDALCVAYYTSWNIITRYTGNDTSINIAGKRMRCWVFKIKYPYSHPPNERIDIMYIEKKSLLPVQRIGTFWFPDQSDPSIIKRGMTKSRIVKVLKRPWDSANRKWRYPKCYYQ